MKYQKVLVITSMLVLLTTNLAGCVVVPRGHVEGPGYGPPPHAPAHGYRSKHHETDLVFDSDLGAYIVMGVPDLYFIDGFYYRISSNDWYYSDRPDGDWHVYQKTLPGKLYKVPGGNKKPAKGNGKENHGNGKKWDD